MGVVGHRPGGRVLQADGVLCLRGHSLLTYEVWLVVSPPYQGY